MLFLENNFGGGVSMTDVYDKAADRNYQRDRDRADRGERESSGLWHHHHLMIWLPTISSETGTGETGETGSQSQSQSLPGPLVPVPISSETGRDREPEPEPSRPPGPGPNFQQDREQPYGPRSR